MRVLNLNLLFSALLLIGLAGCSDDEPEKAKGEINLSDSDAVSKALKFKNVTAVSKNGQIPAASSGDGAPKLYDDYSYDVTSISGANVVLEIDQESGEELVGLYLQVDGAEEYYDISLESSASNGRKAINVGRKGRSNAAARIKEYIDEVLITLPNEFASGKFCVTFAVYDAEGRVSNHIKACVEVLKSGGDESNFLSANEWELVYIYDKEVAGGNVYDGYDSVGKLYTDKYPVNIQCNESSYQEFQVERKRRTNYSRVKFSNDGGFSIENSEYEKQFDYEGSSCENILYFEETDVTTGSGSWAYNSKTKELTLVVEYLFENGNGDRELDLEVDRYLVEVTGSGLLKLSEEYNGGDYSYYSEMYFQSRN